MKLRKITTFIGSRQFKAKYAGEEREFIELSFIEHNPNNLNDMTALKLLTTVNKLRRALDYRKIESLELNKRYIVWLADYKGDKKLKFSGVQLYE